MNSIKHYDIAIIGAGPAGCAAALTLQHSSCSIALFEKATYPRQKICGDGLCDRTINTLKAISPEYFKEFLKTQESLCVKQTEIVYKQKSYLIDFKSFGYICKRYNFDKFLFSLVQRDCKNTTIFQNCRISDTKKDATGITLIDEMGNEYHSSIVLVCNGASSKIARELTQTNVNNSAMGVAVRGYYSNILNLQPGIMELHYKKEFFPGYLWIFPLADGTANVGFGCKINNTKLKEKSLKNILESWIKDDEILQKRFSSAKLLTPIQGGLVPYNIGKFDCYGDNFCICGDAAHLIDPISGGGIGSAMLSGHLAAQQAEQCIKEKNCKKSATKLYADKLQKRVEKEMKTRSTIQQIISNHLWLLDLLAFIGRQKWILNKIKNWYL